LFLLKIFFGEKNEELFNWGIDVKNLKVIVQNEEYKTAVLMCALCMLQETRVRRLARCCPTASSPTPSPCPNPRTTCR